MDQVPPQRPQGPQLRLSMRPDGRAAETDLFLLQDTLREKENNITKDIEQRLAGHRAWLNQYPDLTMKPLAPSTRQQSTSAYRVAVVQYLPSPPASVSAGSPRETSPTETGFPDGPKEDPVEIRYRTPPVTERDHEPPSYRRRIGRGGRLMIDRRGFRLQSKQGIDSKVLDRFRFDRDDEDDEVPVFNVDLYDQWSIQYRAALLSGRDSHSTRPAQVNATRA